MTIKPMVERIVQPTPEEVMTMRMMAGLTQAQTGLIVTASTPDARASHRTWANYEARSKDGSVFRPIPLQTWELFLLLTNQHPDYLLRSRKSSEDPLDNRGANVARLFNSIPNYTLRVRAMNRLITCLEGKGVLFTDKVVSESVTERACPTIGLVFVVTQTDTGEQYAAEYRQ